jgi:hypothetical protein
VSTVRQYLSSNKLTGDDAGALGVGYGDNAVLGKSTFGGQPVDLSSVLIKETYDGDANLDGKVDIQDLLALAMGYKTSGPWTSGDFNYNGFVDSADLAILARNWQRGVGAPLGGDANLPAALGPTGINIPEPTTGVGLAVAILAMLRRSRKRHCAAALAAAGASVATALTVALPARTARADVPGYDLHLLGLTDPEHTRLDGFQLSTERDLNSLGQMVGVSKRFRSSLLDLGQSAWFYDPAAALTLRIGLIDSEHTSFDGYRYSDVLENDNGFAIGFSNRYNRTALYRGQSLWSFNAATDITTRIGLVDAENTRADGYRYSVLQEMNDSGQALGFSNRYSGSLSIGQSLWFYDPSMLATTKIGLTDAEHTRSDGFKNSSGTLINGSGRVVGQSDRFNQGTVNLGQSTWSFSPTSGVTTRIGLTTGPEYTRADGFQNNLVDQFNLAGDVVGHTARYNGGANSLGQSVWYFNPGAGSFGTTYAIGLSDAEHTRADGTRGNFFDILTDSGDVVGHSNRYDQTSSLLGQSVWFFNGGSATTSTIGLIDDEHTSSNDTKNSSIVEVNAASQVVGLSTRYNQGSTSLGQSTWLYDPATGLTTNVGLTDPEHTDQLVGTRNSAPNFLTSSGYVGGYSDRYAVATIPGGGTQSFYAGQSIWIHNPSGSTVPVGLIDATHTYVDPVYVGYTFRRSDLSVLTPGGRAIGFSDRYAGASEYLGQSTWFCDSSAGSLAATVEIGLTDAAHTMSGGSLSGYRYSSTQSSWVNDAGQVVGYSQRFTGVTAQGRDLWFYSPVGGTVAISLATVGDPTDNEHTRADGYRWGDVVSIDTAGHVLGYASRFNHTSSDLGQSSWYFNPANNQTTVIGLVDAVHTRSDGYRFSSVSKVNALGEVLGYSDRYNQTATLEGESAWLFNPAAIGGPATYGLIFSVATDGRANTAVVSFGDDGVILGNYEKFIGNASQGSFAFYYSQANGFFDLGNKVVGGLVGVTKLADPIAEGPDASIYGSTASTIIAGANLPWRLQPTIVTWTGGIAPADGTWQSAADWNLGTPHSENPVVFNLASTYNVSFTGSAQAQAANVLAGQVTWNLPACCLTLGGQLHVGDGITTPTASLVLTGGSLILSGGAQIYSHATLRIAGSSTIQGGITNNGGSFVVAAGQTAKTIGSFINTGTTQVNDSALLRINGTMTNSGTVDLAGGDMILDYTGASPIIAIKAQLLAGYNNGSWTGTGIRSSTAAANAGPLKTAVGYGEASTIFGPSGGVFDGQTVDGTSLLLKYTYTGDANLDGKVDITDLLKLATGWHVATTWTGGDFDYNGVVDSRDLALLAADWQAGVSNPLAPPLDAGLAGLNLPGAVPEPGVYMCISIAGLVRTLTGRRRRVASWPRRS